MIPILGVAGKFTVAPPFSLIENKSYKCRAVSHIQSMVDKGVDVFNDIYVPVNLTQADYENDLNSDEVIVTLKTSDGDILNIPSAYITSVPTDMEVPYNRFALMVDVGLLPSNTSFTFLTDQVQELVKTITGIDTNVSLATLTYDGFVTKEEHAIMVDEREVNIRYNKSPIIELRNTLLREQSLKQRVEALEDLVIALSNDSGTSI